MFKFCEQYVGLTSIASLWYGFLPPQHKSIYSNDESENGEKLVSLTCYRTCTIVLSSATS